MMHRFAAYLLAAGLWATAPQAQDIIDIPLEQAVPLAARALQAGDAELAMRVAEAVLQARPDDRAALLIMAAAAPRTGDHARGRQAGAKAWRLSDEPIQRYEAARLTALAANAEGRLTTASFWLRVALISAPNEAERARTMQDARAVARRNPWATQLTFSLTPSDNVNGGAEEELSSAPGNPTGVLTEDALALPGWRGTIGLTTRYIFQENTQSRSTLRFGGQLSRVKLTGDTTIPDSAFDTGSADLSLSHERRLGEGRFGVTVSIGQVSYRDFDLATNSSSAESYDVTRWSLSYGRSVNDTTALQIAFANETLDYENTAIGTVARNRVSASVTHRLESGDSLRLGYSVTASEGENDNYTSSEYALDVRYSWAEPIGPVTLSAGAGLKWAEYPDYSLIFPVTGGRQDETISANLSVGFPQAEFAGFIPGLRLDAVKTDSNVSRFTRNSLGLGFTLRSSF